MKKKKIQINEKLIKLKILILKKPKTIFIFFSLFLLILFLVLILFRKQIVFIVPIILIEYYSI